MADEEDRAESSTEGSEAINSKIETEDGGGSWWGSWIDSAKSKTSSVFEAVKKDLDELSTAVRTEASNVGAAIESTLKFDEEDSTVGTVKKSLSSFFGQVSEALVPTVEDDDVEVILITRDGYVTLTGFEKHLAELQANDKTYLVEPDKDLIEKYKRWLEVVEQDQFTQNRLARNLMNSEILNDKYANLVPEKVPHMEFWKRYLFKRALLEDALANAEIAERRAKAEAASNKSSSPRKSIIQTEQPKLTFNAEDIDQEAVEISEEDKEEGDISASLEKELLGDEINWENENIECNVELSEEEQIKLLEQYEQEIQEREKRKIVVSVEDQESKITTKNSTAKKLNHKQANQGQKSGSSGKANNMNTNSSNMLTQAKQNNAKGTKIGSSKQKTSQKELSAPCVTDDLELEKDHFKKEEIASNSDESWEKDFDLFE